MEKFGIALIVVTAFWGLLGIVLPLLIPKGPNQALIRMMLILTSACCWLFWLSFYLHQYKPLFGPQLTSLNARYVALLWGQEF